MCTTLRRGLTAAALAGGLWLVGEAAAEAAEPAPAPRDRTAQTGVAAAIHGSAADEKQPRTALGSPHAGLPGGAAPGVAGRTSRANAGAPRQAERSVPAAPRQRASGRTVPAGPLLSVASRGSGIRMPVPSSPEARRSLASGYRPDIGRSPDAGGARTVAAVRPAVTIGTSRRPDRTAKTLTAPRPATKAGGSRVPLSSGPLAAVRPAAKAGTSRAAEGRIRAGSPGCLPAAAPGRAVCRATSRDIRGWRSLRPDLPTDRAGPAGATRPRTGQPGSEPPRADPPRRPARDMPVIDSGRAADRHAGTSMVPAVVALVVLDLLLGVALLAGRSPRRRAGGSGVPAR